MADKQLARNENVDLNTFSDDDPLSELARIVGYDNRPALQQLQELERHRQSVRYDPIVDLEEELMREFDAYDAPAPAGSAPIEPVHAEPPARADLPPVPHMPQVPREAEPAFEAPASFQADDGTGNASIDLGEELEMSLFYRDEALAPAVQPVQVVAPVAVAPSSPVEAIRKNNYPFTPNFSRATPVALNGATPRAFATPLPPAPPVAIAPVAAPAAAVVAAAPVPLAAAEAEPDLDFDLESFEIDLSDVELDLDPAELDLAPPAAVMEAKPVEIRDEDFPETALPFDPSLIAEADDSVSPTGEIDVPQLPAVEETGSTADTGDYDLDIDAEMAQIFSAGRQDAVRNVAGTAAAAPMSGAQQSARSSHEEFADFERAMEEDFRRSLSQRQEVIGQGDRPVERGVYAANTNDGYDEVRPRRRLLLLASAAVVVLVAGGAGAFMMIGGPGAVLSSGEPQIILADRSPTKMVPVEKGGKTVPNQDKAVYDRVAGAQEAAPQQGTLVSTTEEPMDVVQRTLTPETLPLEGSNGLDAAGLDAMSSPADDEGADRLMPDEAQDETAAAEDDARPAVAPRKVRTMIVKPDGTLVAREETVPETVAAAEPDVTPVRTSVPKPADQPAVTTAAVPAVDEDEPTIDALAAAAEATVPPPETAKAQPLPEARPAQTRPVEQPKVAAKPVDTFATATEPAAAETKPVQTASVAPGSPGSYVIQIASLPSDAEAQKSYKSLSGKFGSVIGGRGVDIRKAEIAGKGTYYRVRIPAGTRDEANSLCARLKSAGGSCLVTK